MSTVSNRGEYRVLPLHLIDEPQLAMRETFDEDALMGLADDIRDKGLIQPLVVKPKGERFEIIAGHRRRVALGMIGAVDAPCIVRVDDDVDAEALKVSENAEREDVNAASEAKYFAILLETRCGDDTDVLAKMVGRTREYVESRLLLLKGDPRVLDAIRNGKISLGVARELNAIQDEGQRVAYLHSALVSGATQRLARQWRMDANKFSDMQVTSAAAAGEPAPTPTQPLDSIFRCICCNGDEDTHLMKLVYVHDGCWRSVLRPMLER